MRAIRCLLAAVLAAGIVTVVAAQPFAGFGFGGGGDVNSLVLTNVALQEEIKVTDAQKAKFKPVAEKQTELRKQQTELFAKGFKDIDKEKATELFENSKKVAEDAKKVVDETLTDAQKKRLKQISIQAMSFTVFSDPEARAGKGGRFGGVSEAQKAIIKEVQDALKLTDSQKSSIKEVVDDYNKESRELRTEVFGKGGGFGKVDPDQLESFNKKTDKLRKEGWTKIQDALTAEQKTAWKGLVGEAFDTSKLRAVPQRKD